MPGAGEASTEEGIATPLRVGAVRIAEKETRHMYTHTRAQFVNSCLGSASLVQQVRRVREHAGMLDDAYFLHKALAFFLISQ